MNPTSPSPEQIAATLAAIETQLATGDFESLATSRTQLSTFEKALQTSSGISEEARLSLFPAVITARGHIERALHENELAIDTYMRGIKFVESSNLLPAAKETRIANLLTYRGLAALSIKNSNSAKIAFESFQKTIQIRENSDDQHAPLSNLWALSAAWLNRGDALEQLDGIENREAAIRSYDKAAELLENFDPANNTSIRTRIALAQLKRGAALANLSEVDGRTRTTDSIAAYDRAISVLQPAADSGVPESIRMLAVALSNKARARLQLMRKYTIQGEAEIQQALRWIRPLESSDLELLELGLSARVTFCKTISLDPTRTSETRADEISDLAEEGLSLAKNLFKNSAIPPRFFSIIGQLFRCGGDAYFESQPQFLSEFILDHLDPEIDPLALASVPECHEAAVELLWRGIGTFQHGGFAGLGTEKFNRSLELHSEWHRCRKRLAEIRNKNLPQDTLEHPEKIPF